MSESADGEAGPPPPSPPVVRVEVSVDEASAAGEREVQPTSEAPPVPPRKHKPSLSVKHKKQQQTSPSSKPGKASQCDYLHKVEVRALGVLSRRRYWCVLSPASSYLYWFKERDDVQCVGRLALAGCAFTFDPRETGRFEIHVGADVHVFECSSNKQREEWMAALQETRKRSWQSGSSSPALGRSRLNPLSPSPLPLTPSPRKDEEEKTDDTLFVPEEEERKRSREEQKAIDDLVDLLGPVQETEEEGGEKEQHENGEPLRVVSPLAVAASRFYLSTDGALNDLSLQMPELEPTVLSRISERATVSMEVPLRAMHKARKSLRRLSTGECARCKTLVSQLDERDAEWSEQETALVGVCEALRQGLTVANAQIECMKELSSSTPEQQMDHLLEKERELCERQLTCTEQGRRIGQLEEENRSLEQRVTELEASCEAFKESLRTKEELIMRMCEAEAEGGTSGGGAMPGPGGIISDVEVPEGILVEMAAGAEAVENAERQVFEEQCVKDVHELKDLLEGYRAQNAFLNHEIVELQQIIASLEERERRVSRQHFDIEAVYYQLKSRYIMLLNHFKNPDKPGKVMEPGVLRQLIEEATGTADMEQRQQRDTDVLGFYLESKGASPSGGAGGAGDMLYAAVDCQRRANEIVEAKQLEQSEEYMHWLQSWDAFLVNCVDRPLTDSAELKALVRTSIPPTYRARVWKSLVSMRVRERQADLGGGYFESMLRRAKKRVSGGEFDPAIKQIDLDLARTLPTNKYFEEPSSNRIESLRKVLYAYREHNKEVGYCQGLNRLAAIALLYLQEEDAFWFLTACVEDLQPHAYYTSTLVGAVADQKVLSDLVADRLPRLATHLKQLDVDLSLFTLGWFLTCFVDALPHSLYLPVFDVFLNEGNKALFRFALALLKAGEAKVLRCKTVGTAHNCLSRPSEFVGDWATLAKVALSDLNPFPQKSIDSKRQHYLAQLREHGYR